MFEDSIIFLKGFLKNPRANASIAPSSKKLAIKMLEGIDFESVDTVVEFGPGTGVFTVELLKKVKPGTKVILIELQKTYIDKLTKKFGDKVVVENDSVENVSEILNRHGIDKLDLIVSGLGFVAFPPKLLEKVQFDIKNHTDNGTVFRTFTYRPKVFEKKFEYMNVVKVSGPIINFPLAYVYAIN